MKAPLGTLRSGYTTGACSAAAARAAWEFLRDAEEPTSGRGRPHESGPRRLDAGLSGHSGDGRVVPVRFPDGRDRVLPVAGVARIDAAAEAWVVKDAGDDPDVTHGSTVRVRVEPCAPEAVQEADFVEPCNAGQVVLRAGQGVGRVMRRGLDVPSGKWAINPTPRRMIVENLALAGLGTDGSRWLVTVGIDGGEELARRTLNPVLGIVGGLSILGTSGIVVPCSNQAYLATIRILLRGAREMGCTTAVLATGGRTHRCAQPSYPALPEAAFVRIGDFIREAIDSAATLGFERIGVACMPGKLAKYALGLTCTHAHVAAMSMTDLARSLEERGAAPAVVDACRRDVSVRGFLEGLDDATQRAVLAGWAGQALDIWTAWAPQCRFDLLLFENDGRSIDQWTRQAIT